MVKRKRKTRRVKRHVEKKGPKLFGVRLPERHKIVWGFIIRSVVLIVASAVTIMIAVHYGQAIPFTHVAELIVGSFGEAGAEAIGEVEGV